MPVNKQYRSGGANVTMFDPADGGAYVINNTDIETASVYSALAGQHPEVAALVRWSMDTKGDLGNARQQGIFARDRYVTPQNIFAQFDTARDAATNDDVVSGVLESTESLAFNRLTFTCEEQEEEDLWDQIAYDIDLETRIREMWRELAITSQIYYCVWYGVKSYKLRGKTSAGVRRKKTFDGLRVPLGMTMLDPKKVVRIGSLMFNQSQLAYIADRTETDLLDAAVLNDPQADPVSRQIIVAKYAPPDYERRNLQKIGINPDWLYVLNPVNCFYHALTMNQFQRFADVRMKSVFELLDLKNQLRQMDRATLIGGSNFIVLIRKGSDHLPAKPEEIQALQGQVSSLARVPVIVGDHRLSVEIVTPKTDMVLSNDKYSTLDSRIQTRLYQMFLIHGGGGSVRSDDSIKLAKVIARGLESRRAALKRTLERQVLGPTVAANDQLTSMPKMRFHPTRIQLDLDPAWVQLILDVRDRGDLSRDSMLNELDFDQEDEARQRLREKEVYDKVFSPTIVPFSSPKGDQGANEPKTDPRTGGRNGGGLKNGGGASANPDHGLSEDQQA